MFRDSVKSLLVRSGVVGMAAAVMSSASASPTPLPTPPNHSPTLHPAVAIGAEPQPGTSLFAEPGVMIAMLNETDAEQDGAPSRTITVSRFQLEVDGKDIEVEVRNNEVTLATIDGRAIPRSRIIRGESNGSITIIGDDNTVLVEIPVVQPPSATPGAQPRQRVVVRSAPSIPYPPGTPVLPGAPSAAALYGRVPVSIIGIVPRDLPDRDAVVIDAVREGLGAEQAGLRAGDVIVAIDGIDGINADKLRDLIGKRKPGTDIRMTIERDGGPMNITVTTSENPAAAGQPARPQVFTSPARPGAAGGAWVIRERREIKQDGEPDLHVFEWVSPENLPATPFYGRDSTTMLRFNTIDTGDAAALLGQIRDQIRVELDSVDLGNLEKRLTERLSLLLEPIRREGTTGLRVGATPAAAQALESRLGEIENRLERMETLLQRIAEQNDRREQRRRE